MLISKEQFLNYSHLYLALSGGLDSVVLLHQLSQISELLPKLSVIHVHHGLSPNADEWVKTCDVLCSSYNIPFILKRVRLKNNNNIEEQARLLRYDCFKSLVKENDAIILAHHANDQAETLLLQLCRGTGVDGLAGMSVVQPFLHAYLLRPFLALTRQQLEVYAKEHQLTWVEDESNQNLQFSRNFIRHQVIPLLQERWPGVVLNLSQCASLCQEAQSNLFDLAKHDASNLTAELALNLTPEILTLPLPRLKNILRAWFKINQVKKPSQAILNQIIREVIFAKKDAKPQVKWGEYCLRIYQKQLFLDKTVNSQEKSIIPWHNFPKNLDLCEGNQLLARPTQEGLMVLPNSKVEIRFREQGESLRLHQQTKSLKKLFQTWKVPPWKREHVPLIYIDNQLAVVVGYAIDDKFYKKNESHLYDILLKAK